MFIPLSLLSNEKRYRSNQYIHNNRIIVGRVLFYAVRVVSRKAEHQFFPEIVFILYLFVDGKTGYHIYAKSGSAFFLYLSCA
jgi:hypothetical protein